MDWFKKKIKTSYLVVNKIHLFLIFLLLTIEDMALGIYYFLISLVIFIWKILNARIPLDVDEDLKPDTYVYKRVDDKELKMDIWFPSMDMRRYPLVFFCHGGGWISGFRNQPNNVSWCKFLASRGLAVASIDYRYGYRNTMEDILCDYTDALNYIRDNSGKLSIDVEHIVLMGLSAGGHLALSYAAYNTHQGNWGAMKGIKSVVAYYAPTDLNDIFMADTKSIFAKFATKQTFKGGMGQDSSIYDYYSPIHWITKDMIPCLLAHGRMDTTVPFSSSLRFADELKRFGVKHTLLVHRKGGHSFDTKLNDISTVHILEKTVGYIKKTII
ncbi:MAG: alpha/beta hydrolase [Tissierellia bacterium]|nr:alpha/beta hydrolase [Tissierellia bacterium]